MLFPKRRGPDRAAVAVQEQLENARRCDLAHVDGLGSPLLGLCDSLAADLPGRLPAHRHLVFDLLCDAPGAEARKIAASVQKPGLVHSSSRGAQRRSQAVEAFSLLVAPCQHKKRSGEPRSRAHVSGRVEIDTASASRLPSSGRTGFLEFETRLEVKTMRKLVRLQQHRDAFAAEGSSGSSGSILR